jgi:hypothetical protein
MSVAARKHLHHDRKTVLQLRLGPSWLPLSVGDRATYRSAQAEGKAARMAGAGCYRASVILRVRVALFPAPSAAVT